MISFCNLKSQCFYTFFFFLYPSFTIATRIATEIVTHTTPSSDLESLVKQSFRSYTILGVGYLHQVTMGFGEGRRMDIEEPA